MSTEETTIRNVSVSFQKKILFYSSIENANTYLYTAQQYVIQIF
jgi:hypothetical protein